MSENIVPDDLKCGITHDLLDDPITLPCCGRAVSRTSISECLSTTSKLCPFCRKDLSDFDAVSVPKSINLAYLVENYKNEFHDTKIVKQDNNQKQSQSHLKAEIKVVPLLSVYQTVIGQLEIKNTNNNFTYKTLLVPVIDKSGSMAGSPIKQVQYSLNRLLDLTYKFQHIITNLITYDDRATVIEIDKTRQLNYYSDIVSKLQGSCGTSFQSAFDQVVTLCNKYQQKNDISSLVVIFLTDGEDSSVQKNARADFVKQFKYNLEKVWTNKQYTVHCVGFGNGHDYDFLNNLRQIGTKEGAYRFADGAEDFDSLSSKINSLLDVIATSSSIPLKLKTTSNSVPIIAEGNDKTKYWVNLTGYNVHKSYDYIVDINNESINLSAEFTDVTVGEDDRLKNEWLSYLIDEIAGEMLILSKYNETNIPIEKQIFNELLLQRARSIYIQLDETSSNASRLNKLIELLMTMKLEGSVNQCKLTDIKFEGNFATKKLTGDPTKQGTCYMNTIQYNQNIDYQLQQPITKKNDWSVVQTKGLKRCSAKINNNITFIVVLGSHKNNVAQKWISEQQSFDEVDTNGSNVLIVASSIGRCLIVKSIIATGKIDINSTNKNGYSALDMASLYGHWYTFDVLYQNGAKSFIDSELLLRTCLSNKYFNICQRLVKYKIAQITDDMLTNVPTNEGLQWLSAHSQKNISVESAIYKGIYNIVEEQIGSIGIISWQPYLDIFVKPSPDHVKIVNLLLENKKVNPEEIIELIKDDGEKGTTWPLFITCEKGHLEMFKVLMKYVSKEFLNKQNNSGTTILWIACCNKHIDIVGELLYKGADPNICNVKGDSPLIPCCQKGNSMLVELLLDNGIRHDLSNKNGDNAVLICCRTGQADILEILLKRLKEVGNNDDLAKILSKPADIDGFNPLLAATELDKTSCIKVCQKYGANLEARTSDDNKILPGATAMHLACFYGRLASVKTLHELGASITSQTTVHGYTPLHVAIRQGHTNVVKFLLSLKSVSDCLNTRDYTGKLPKDYAHMTGNELLLEEIFVNKLSLLMEKCLYINDEATEEKCTNVLSKYGRSLSCYEYNEITNLDMDANMSLLSLAILHDKRKLFDVLKNMGEKDPLYRPDNCGIKPIFWRKLLDKSVEVNDEETKKMINRVHEIAKKNVQNKFLMNLQQKNVLMPLLIDNGNMISKVTKMSDGFDYSPQKNALVTLKNSRNIEHSLLQFIDKLKSNKLLFPDGKEYLEHMLWNAKIHLIRVIATNKDDDNNNDDELQPIHIIALYFYTSNVILFQQVNKTLTNWSDAKLWHPFISCLYQACTMLPKYIGEVYRAVDKQFDKDDYKKGTIIKWSTFSICSKEFSHTTKLIDEKRGIVFIIKSLTGRLVGHYSKTPVDNEVIFLPESQFEVTNLYVASTICLGQENIRSSTFTALDEHLQKVTDGKACIIVELKEI